MLMLKIDNMNDTICRTATKKGGIIIIIIIIISTIPKGLQSSEDAEAPKISLNIKDTDICLVRVKRQGFKLSVGIFKSILAPRVTELQHFKVEKLRYFSLTHIYIQVRRNSPVYRFSS